LFKVCIRLSRLRCLKRAVLNTTGQTVALTNTHLFE